MLVLSIICNGVESALERISVDEQQGGRRDQLEVRAEKSQDKGEGRPFLGIALICPSERGVEPLGYGIEFYKHEDLGEFLPALFAPIRASSRFCR